MQNFIVSLELIFPMMLYMGLGSVLGRVLSLENKTLNQINRLVYSVFLPLYLFRSIYTADLQQDFSLFVLLYAFGATLLLFVVLLFLIPKIEGERSNQSVMVQGIYRSNYALFGMAMTNLLYGAENMGMAAMVATVIVPMFSILAVFLFEYYRAGQMNWGTCLKNIATNPLIIASLLGLVFLVVGVPIPEFVMRPLSSLADMATPLALIVLGAMFSFSNLWLYRRQLAIVVIGKLIVVPAVFVVLGRGLGITGVNLFVLMTLFGSPTSVSSFSMASQLGGKKELAGLIVAVTSVCSVVTFFLWTFLLMQWGWI